MSFKRYMDAAGRRLIYLGSPATPDYWDRTWQSQRLSRDELLDAAPTTWSRINREYLSPTDGPVVEGGCGFGMQVAAMRNDGFQVVGVDFAPNTIEFLRDTVPEMEFQIGDVRDLKLESNSYAGYWSLGVIEHFWEGYDDIIQEAHRVLKPQGLLFLVFPYMNPVRRFKAMAGLFSRWKTEKPEAFYQFALCPDAVLRKAEGLGFHLVERRAELGRQGFEEEFPRLSHRLSKMYQQTSPGLISRGFRKAMHVVSQRLMRHSCYSYLLVLQRN